MFYNDIVISLQTYLVRGDRAALRSALRAVEAELEAPTLYPDVIQIDRPVAEIEADVVSSGSIVVSGLTSNVRAGHLVRITGNDSIEDTCLVFKATYTDANNCVLVPVG